MNAKLTGSSDATQNISGVWFPDAKSKLVVQDLPPVIEDIKDLHRDIVRQKYDFFTPQPVVGKSLEPLFTTEPNTKLTYL